MHNHSNTTEILKQSSSEDKESSIVDYKERVMDKSRYPYFLILFIISPVLGALSAAANFRQKGAKAIIILFFGVFGYTLILRESADSYRLMLDFVYHFGSISFSEFAGQMYDVLMLSSPRHYGGTGNTIDDFYLPFVSFSVSRFTLNPSWFFAVVGIVYGYFYLKGVSAVYEESRQNLNLTLGILFIFFFSWIFLDGVNAPQTLTANWVLFSGVFLYLKTNNIKYVYLVFMAPLVHFGFIAMIMPFVVYYFFRDLKYVYVTILIISFFASASMSFVEPYLMATELGQNKLNAYAITDNVDGGSIGHMGDNRSFHARHYLNVAYYSIYFMFFISLIWAGYISNKYHDRLENGLASLAILMLSFANFASVIPVLSNRLSKSFALFALAYLIVLYSKNWDSLKKRRWIVYVCVPFILLFLFTKYSIIGDFTDFRLFFSPLAYPFLGEDPVSIKEFIRSLVF